MVQEPLYLRNVWCLFTSGAARLELTRFATVEGFARLANNIVDLFNHYRVSDTPLLLSMNKASTCAEWDAPSGSYLIIPVDEASFPATWTHLAAFIVGQASFLADDIKGLVVDISDHALQLLLWTSRTDPSWMNGLMHELAAVTGNAIWFEFVQHHILSGSTPSAGITARHHLLSERAATSSGAAAWTQSPDSRVLQRAGRYAHDFLISYAQRSECQASPTNFDGTEWGCLIECSAALTRQMVLYHDTQSTAASMLKQALDGDDVMNESDMCIGVSTQQEEEVSVAGSVAISSSAASPSRLSNQWRRLPAASADASAVRLPTPPAAEAAAAAAASTSDYSTAPSRWNADQHGGFGDHLGAGAFVSVSASSTATATSGEVMQVTTTLAGASPGAAGAGASAAAPYELPGSSRNGAVTTSTTTQLTENERDALENVDVVMLLMEQDGAAALDLLEASSAAVRIHLLQKLSGPALLEVASDVVGIESLHSLVIHLRPTNAETEALRACLTPHVAALATHQHAHQLLVYVLQQLKYPDTRFVVDAMTQHCLAFASDRHGLKVAKALLSSHSPRQVSGLLAELAKQAPKLVEDQFGNYILQMVICMGPSRAGDSIVGQLGGRFAWLSSRKFSSNVVEACLRSPHRAWSDAAMQEVIMAASTLVSDRYGNYVLQTALSVASGARSNGEGEAEDGAVGGRGGRIDASEEAEAVRQARNKQVDAIGKAVRPVLSSMRHNVRAKWHNLIKDAEQLVSTAMTTTRAPTTALSMEATGTTTTTDPDAAAAAAATTTTTTASATTATTLDSRSE